MDKKLILSIVVAIASTMTFSSCNGNSKSSNSGEGPGKVDSYAETHYSESQIKEAIQRDIDVQNFIRPTDASSFGEKKAEVKWRAFEKDMKEKIFVKEKGEVIIIHYEHGLEIIKDGQHWFYDGFEYDDYNISSISAGIAILHRPRWEPVCARFSGADLLFEYLYPIGHKTIETFFIAETILEILNINRIGDIILSVKKY